MRSWFFVFCFLVMEAEGRIVHQMPGAMDSAPVARAIDNVATDQSLSEAQRARLLGRLHLIAYAQSNALVQRFRSGEWAAVGEACGDPAYLWRWRALDYRNACPVGLHPPPREVPDLVAEAQTGGSQHLLRARTFYARAVALDSSDLRAHLGFAFVLDRLGETEAARAQLRQNAEIGMRRLGGRWVDWETHAALFETAEHFNALARTGADRRIVRQLRQRLGDARPMQVVTPIVVPLTDAPFAQLADPASAVAFDFAGIGDTRAQGWLTPDAAWLVWDPEQQGEVRSGFDMLGQSTWAVFWSDGFEALRSLDDNGDGELTGAELGGLALWRDANVNGISEPGEVRPVSEHGVIGLAVLGQQVREGLLETPNGVRFEDGGRLALYDWTPGLERMPTS